MTIITTTTGSWLFVTIPDGATNIEYRTEHGDMFLCYWIHGMVDYNKIPKGWEPFALPDTITEGEAKQVVEECKHEDCTHAGYMEYCPISKDKYGEIIWDPGPYETAIKSLNSLLRANHLTGRYATLKQTT